MGAMSKASRQTIILASGAVLLLLGGILVFGLSRSTPRELPGAGRKERDAAQVLLRRHSGDAVRRLARWHQDHPEGSLHLGINPWTSKSLDILIYLFPLLSREGLPLEFPFILPDKADQVNKSLGSADFTREDARQIIFEGSPLWTYAEYVDFMVALNHFNRGLPPEERVRLTAPGISADAEGANPSGPRLKLFSLLEDFPGLPEGDLLIVHHTPLPGYPAQGLFESSLPGVQALHQNALIPLKDLQEIIRQDLAGIPLPQEGFLWVTGPLHRYEGLTPEENAVNDENMDRARTVLKKRSLIEGVPGLPPRHTPERWNTQKRASRLNAFVRREARQWQGQFDRLLPAAGESGKE